MTRQSRVDKLSEITPTDVDNHPGDIQTIGIPVDVGTTPKSSGVPQNPPRRVPLTASAEFLSNDEMRLIYGEEAEAAPYTSVMPCNSAPVNSFASLSSEKGRVIRLHATRNLAWSFRFILFMSFVGCLCCLISPWKIYVFLAVLLHWLVSLCLHEYSHSVVAYLCGDDSVPQKGYLTLDLMRYADPVASFLLPCLFLILGGIALPGGSVLVNNQDLDARWKQSSVAFAGPVANILYGVFIRLILGLLRLLFGNTFLFYNSLGSALTFVCYVQGTAALFNLIPLPPLDGWGFISPWFPKSWGINSFLSNPWHFKAASLICFSVIYLLMVRTSLLGMMAIPVINGYMLNTSLLNQGMDKFHILRF